MIIARRTFKHAGFLALVTAIAGCTSMSHVVEPFSCSKSPLEVFAITVSQSDTGQLKAQFAQTMALYQSKPSTRNRIRLALILAQPGHPHHDPDNAAELLKEALRDNSLSRDERRFVQLQQAWVQRTATLTKENTALRTQLNTAEKKLRAINEIEEDLQSEMQ